LEQADQRFMQCAQLRIGKIMSSQCAAGLCEIEPSLRPGLGTYQQRRDACADS
jgi:hypothetical protein